MIGQQVEGGEVFELKSDLGGGKTSFIKGLAKGMGVKEVVQSPTFTISFVHQAKDNLELHHFDFYRLQDPGILSLELAETLNRPNVVVAIEWGEVVQKILPKNTTTITIKVLSDNARQIIVDVDDTNSHIIKALGRHKV